MKQIQECIRLGADAIASLVLGGGADQLTAAA
jgi:hypothetical protein